MATELPEIKHRPEVDQGAVDITYPDGTRIDLMVEGGVATVYETYVSHRVLDLAEPATSGSQEQGDGGAA